MLRKEGKHEENKSGEREGTLGDDDKHSPADVPRAVSVTQKSLNHKKHTIAAQPSQKSSAKAFSLVDSGPPTQTFSHAQKTRQQETSFSDIGDHSHHCLHSFLLVTCFCPLLSDPLDKNTRRDKKGQET